MRQKIAVPCRNYSGSVRRQGSVMMRREAEVQTSDNSDYDDTVADTAGEETVNEDRVETVSGIVSYE